jgi:hypothetical protein
MDELTVNQQEDDGGGNKMFERIEALKTQYSH